MGRVEKFDFFKGIHQCNFEPLGGFAGEKYRLCSRMIEFNVDCRITKTKTTSIMATSTHEKSRPISYQF